MLINYFCHIEIICIGKKQNVPKSEEELTQKKSSRRNKNYDSQMNSVQNKWKRKRFVLFCFTGELLDREIKIILIDLLQVPEKFEQTQAQV